MSAAITPIIIQTGADIAPRAQMSAGTATVVIKVQAAVTMPHEAINALTLAITGATASPIDTIHATRPVTAPATSKIFLATSGFSFAHFVTRSSIGIIFCIAFVRVSSNHPSTISPFANHPSAASVIPILSLNVDMTHEKVLLAFSIPPANLPPSSVADFIASSTIFVDIAPSAIWSFKSDIL